VDVPGAGVRSLAAIVPGLMRLVVDLWRSDLGHADSSPVPFSSP